MMFQHCWFNKKAYLEKPVPEALPSNFIKKDEISYQRVTMWEEHCLECAMPHCYHHCEKYIERKDGRCIKLTYGIRSEKIGNTLTHATVQFEPWGKLETVLCPVVVTPKAVDRRYRLNNLFSSLLKGISDLLPTHRYVLVNGWYHVLRNHLKKPASKQMPLAPFFLFQCYSHEAEEYNMFFELSFDGKNYHKESFRIRKGYNQFITPISAFQFGKESLARIYPENNLRAELTIFALDFIGYDYKAKKPAQKVKCVAWDLDNTVWDGIFIESEPSQLQLRAGVLETMQELDRRGFIQIVVSKNTLSEVEDTLKRLGIDEYFVYKFVNWSSKSNNLVAAADVLNINIDTFALIDDSEIERREISEVLHCVRTYDEKNIRGLLELPEFDVPVTADSVNRRKMYQVEAKRKNIEKMYIGSNVDFLKSCEISVDIMKITNEERFDRCYELVQRTNQLNLSGIKYDRESIRKMLAESESFVFSCKDQYGTYGIVGFVLFDVQDKAVEIREFAMSCRVASKFIESALMNWLQQKYHRDIVLKGNTTNRNQLLVHIFTEIGFQNTSDQEKIYLRLPISSKCDHWDVVRIEDADVEDEI